MRARRVHTCIVHLTGTDLEQRWAPWRDAEGQLPRLVRWLIQSTLDARDLRRLDLPDGEGITKPGPDGWVETIVGNTYVPGGASLWEMGRSRDFEKKARKDFRNRTFEHPPTGVDPAKTTFVFVTPRRWRDRGAEELKWREEGVWKDVRIYDADDLSAWLQSAPGVEVWLAELLGRPGPLQSLDRHWQEWSRATQPTTSEGLVLAGREDECEHLLEWLAGPPSALSVQATDVAEAIAFCWASLQQMPERESWLARAIVVAGDDQLRKLSLEPPPLLLAARDCSIGLVKLAAEVGHHVLLTTEHHATRHDLVLPPLDPPQAQAALERMGFPPERARKLILDIRGALPGRLGVSLEAIRRELGSLDGELPEELAPLVLVGAWTNDEADLQAVCEILGAGPEQLRGLLQRHGTLPNSPLVCEDDRWRWASRRDALRQLGQRLLPENLAAFAKVFIGLFATEGYQGSSELRRGLLEGLALLATEPDWFPSNYDGSFPERIVSRLLLLRTDIEQWSALKVALTTLAEIAPDFFLDQASSRIIPFGFVGTAPPELITALRVLAWREEHLDLVTELLGRVADAERLDGCTNLALETLLAIYQPWHPQTVASVQVRLARLDSLAKLHPQTAVELTLKLLSSSGSVRMTVPQYRNWAEEAREITDEDARAVVVHSWNLLLDVPRKNPQHWLAIISKISRFPHEQRTIAINGLTEIDETRLDTAQRKALREHIRSLIHHQRRRRGPADNWTIPEDQLLRLEAVYDQLELSDPRDSLGWLFESAPTLLHPSITASLKEFSENLGKERRAAAQQFSAALSADELAEFSGQVGAPSELGYALGCLDPDGRTLELLHASVSSEHSGSREYRMGLGKALAKHGTDPATLSLPDPCRADVLLGYPHDPATWNVAESLGPGVVDEYWRHNSHLYIWRPEHIEHVLRALLRVGRAAAALEVAGAAILMKTASLDVPLIVEVLHAAAEPDPERSRYPTHDNIPMLLGQLRDAGPGWRDELRRLEWALLHAFDFDCHHPHALFEALANDPGYFAASMKLAYPQRRLDDDELDDASRARELLRHWNLLPGLQPDGRVDLDQLRDWLRAVHAELSGFAKPSTVDRHLGEALANTPAGEDGLWPHEALRELLEELDITEEFEAGLEEGHQPLSAGWIDSDGDRARAEKLSEDAKAMRKRWPKTARLLDKLARRSQDDERMWDHVRRRGIGEFDRTEPATTRHRVEAFLVELQKHRRYVFDYEELVTAIGGHADLRRVLHDLPSVAMFAADAYVVVRPEYQDQGAPPPLWYLHELMAREDLRYCVGLLSAAAMYGAAPQQPQIWQVLVDRPREPAKVGAHVIEFVVRARAQEFTTRQVNTITGFMLVATAEATVFDLAEFAHLCGGQDAVIEVYEDLGEELDADALSMVAVAYPPEVVARAAAMLDEAGHRSLARRIRQPPSQRALGAS